MAINPDSDFDCDPGYDLALVVRALDGEAQEALWRMLVDAEMAGEAKAKAQSPSPPEAQPQPPLARKPRKLGIVTIIRHAEKAGRPVTSITTPDGTVLHFGEPQPSEATNPWLADLDKVTKQ